MKSNSLYATLSWSIREHDRLVETNHFIQKNRVNDASHVWYINAAAC